MVKIFLPYSNQVLSASLEWSVISIMKQFVFVVIALSSSVTGLSAYLTEKSKCLIEENGNQKGDKDERDAIKDESNGEDQATQNNTDLGTSSAHGLGEAVDNNESDKDVERDTDEEKQVDEQSQVKDTCSALGSCLCALGLCCFTPFTSSCCRFARGENPYSFTFYLANGFNFFWRGFQLRFLTAFGNFSSGLVELLSVPVRNEEERFFSAKSSLVAL